MITIKFVNMIDDASVRRRVARNLSWGEGAVAGVRKRSPQWPEANGGLSRRRLGVWYALGDFYDFLTKVAHF